MARRIFSSETWRKLGQPDVGSKMYYFRDGKKVWGEVVMSNFGHKKGVELKIKPLKK